MPQEVQPIPFIPSEKITDIETVQISLLKQTFIYLGSLLLPPLGLVWGFKYLKQKDPAVKRVGYLAILLTVISLVLTVWLSFKLVNTLNQSFNNQIDLERLDY